MKNRRKKYGENEKNYFLGMYENKYSKTGLMQIPKEYARTKRKVLYCVKIRDLSLDVETLRCFYSYEDVEECVLDCKEYAIYKIETISKHRILPIVHYIQLPKEFYRTGKNRKIHCIGIGKSFEIWKEADYLKISKEWEVQAELLEEDILSIIECEKEDSL